jgi:hypothetical protein
MLAKGSSKQKPECSQFSNLDVIRYEIIAFSVNDIHPVASPLGTNRVSLDASDKLK